MSLKEQLEKVQKELQKLEEQKKDALIREKELKLKIELEEPKSNGDCRRTFWRNDGEKLGTFSENNAGTVRTDEMPKRKSYAVTVRKSGVEVNEKAE